MSTDVRSSDTSKIVAGYRHGGAPTAGGLPPFVFFNQRPLDSEK